MMRLLAILFWLAPLASGAKVVYGVRAGSAPVLTSNIEGGYMTDAVTGVAVDAQGNAFITGNAISPVVPVT